MSKKIRVALFCGGKSGEHEVSIVSALSVLKALDRSKYEVTLIGIDKQGRWGIPDEKALLTQGSNPKLVSLGKTLQDVSLLPYESKAPLVPVSAGSLVTSEGKAFDVVIPVLHGTGGEDGTIQGLLELAGIPYVGSGVLGSAVGMDKDASKRLLRDAGIPVVPFLTVRRSRIEKDVAAVANEAEKLFGYPYFAKPANTGSSVGVNKIKSRAEAEAKLRDAAQYDSKILIEQGIAARELECAVLGNENPQASIVGEIIPTHDFYSFEAKYVDENGAHPKIPADIDPALAKRIQQLALRAFTALETSGLARVDFFLDKKTNELYLNEINTFPGFTPISMYPKLWEASGIPYAKLLDKLIELALERHAERMKTKTNFVE